MIETVMTQFDGRAFVPDQPVNLPKGRQVAVSFEKDDANQSWIDDEPPKPFTEEERLAWEGACPMVLESDIEHLSLDELMRYVRGRP